VAKQHGSCDTKEGKLMTKPIQKQIEEPADLTNRNWARMGRRPVLKALGAGAVLSVGSDIASAADEEHGGDEDQNDDADDSGPKGFKTEVVAPHATFADDVAAAVGVTYEDDVKGSAFLHDASTVVIVRASLEPGGSSGWHIDKGPAIAVVVDGTITVTFKVEDGCVSNTYAAGEAVLATGEHADVVENASDTEPAMAYIVFLGVPEGEPPSKTAEPADC
jgi:quercetin dioxygenase-like cupin family protein